MKKFKKILLILMGIFPAILNAETNEKEWRWYTFIEENVHYEKDVENICEDFESFNKEIFVYGDYVYSLTKPEEKDYREIEEVYEKLSISRDYVNVLKLTGFKGVSTPLKISELEIKDKDDNPVKFTIKQAALRGGEIESLTDNDHSTYVEVVSFSTATIEFEQTENIKELTIILTYKEDNNFLGLSFSVYLNEEIFTNAFANYSTNNETTCEDGTCTLKIKVKESDMNNENFVFGTKVYKYRDKYYKCYTLTKLYVPGYHSNLEGFIKDENEYRIKETKTETYETESTPNNVVENIVLEENNTETNENELLEPELNETSNEEESQKNDKIAMATEQIIVKDNNTLRTFLILFISISIIGTLIFLTKKRRKCRTK